MRGFAGQSKSLTRPLHPPPLLSATPPSQQPTNIRNVETRSFPQQFISLECTEDLPLLPRDYSYVMLVAGCKKF